MAFADQVRDVLSDTMNLPSEFLNFLPQFIAQNPVAAPRIAGQEVAFGSRNATVAATGTTFATGTDLLSAPLEFTATGQGSYILYVFAAGWSNTNIGTSNSLYLNLDGASGGVFCQSSSTTANAIMGCTSASYISAPSQGRHSVNARLVVGSGTGSVFGASASGYLPILLSLRVA